MIKPPAILRWILFAIPAALYGLAVQMRLWLYQWNILKPARLRNPTISIGNLTVGGTGKTPIVELVARVLKQEGESVVILSRGYKAKDNSQSHQVSDGAHIQLSWEEAGDEPYLLARNLPGVKVYIGRDRYRSGRQAEGGDGACVFVLDDGFQHLQLGRTLNVLLIDATDPFGGGRLLPLGRLRETRQGIRRADVIMVTRSDHPFDEEALSRRIRRYHPSVHLLFAYHDVVGLMPVHSAGRREIIEDPEKERLEIRDFSGESVVAVSGIGRPDLFEQDITHFQLGLAKSFRFPDHHQYTQSEVDKIISEAYRLNVRMVMTTEKDAVRLAALDLKDMPFYYLRIEAKVEDEGRLRFYLESALGRFGA